MSDDLTPVLREQLATIGRAQILGEKELVTVEAVYLARRLMEAIEGGYRLVRLDPDNGGATGHCRHCRQFCHSVDFLGLAIHTSASGEVSWAEGRCPACAEAERIEAKLLDEYHEDDDIAVRAALRIARGET